MSQHFHNVHVAQPRPGLNVQVSRFTSSLSTEKSACSSRSPESMVLPNPRVILSSGSTVMIVLHNDAVLTLLGLTSFLTLLDFGYHALKGLANVLIEPGTCFCPATIEFLGELTTIFRLDLALLWSQIGFVADNDQRDRFGTLEYSCQRGVNRQAL